uniref:Uncharacterized protein n=1 Tax=Arcella intermedia TaxID=1963864 RepID=A0A6B2LD43_9EUKA
MSLDKLPFLCDILKSNTTLKSLHLSSNQIGSQEVKYIADFLKINSTLTKLNLSYNSIGPEGAKHIRDALKNNSSLTELDLFDNKLGTEGAVYMSELLKINTTLSVLYLDKNKIESAGVNEIAKAIETNTSLSRLYLTDNVINNGSILITALENNFTLIDLCYGNIKLEEVITKKLLERNKDIQLVVNWKANYKKLPLPTKQIVTTISIIMYAYLEIPRDILEYIIKLSLVTLQLKKHNNLLDKLLKGYKQSLNTTKKEMYI